MSRIVTVTLALALVVAAVPVAPTAAAAVAPSGSSAATTVEAQPDGKSTSLSPGQQLTGVLGVQAAELEGEVETRTFDRELERAETNTSKAAVLAAQIERIRTRLSAYRSQLSELERAREQGELSEREYRVRVAHIAARMRALDRLAERSERVSSEMPLGLLEASGVNVTAAYAIGVETDVAAGGEVGAIAAAVAGPETGNGFETRPDRARARGLIEELTTMIRRGEHLVDRASERVPDDDERAVTTIETARRYLYEARTERDAAVRAANTGAYENLTAHAKRSRADVRRAIVSAHRAERIANVDDQRTDRAESAIDYAERALATARQAVGRAESAGVGDDRRASAILNRARTHLSAGKQHLATARTAYDDEEYPRAMREAKQSIARSELATREARAVVAVTEQETESDERATEAIADAEERLSEAERRVKRASSTIGDDRSATEALASACDRLETARSTLDRARTAAADGNAGDALRLAREAQANADAAASAADRAVRLAEHAEERQTEDDRARTPTDEDSTDDRDRDRDESETDDRTRRTETRSRSR